MDLNKDVCNWWGACNKASHGVEWKLKIGETIRSNKVGKTEDEAFKFLILCLKEKYNKKETENYIRKIQAGFDNVNKGMFKKNGRCCRTKNIQR